MAKRDFESIMDRAVAILKNDLNARLVAISAEKNDGVELKPVLEEAYFLHFMTEKTANFDPYLYVGMNDAQGQGLGPRTFTTLPIVAILVLTDAGNDNDVNRRVLRYGRALKEIFESKWDDPVMGKISISSLAPVSWASEDTGNIYRAVGVEIQATLG